MRGGHASVTIYVKLEEYSRLIHKELNHDYPDRIGEIESNV
jgi:hypothetical protein